MPRKIVIRNETQFIAKIIRPMLELLRWRVEKHTQRFSSGYPDLSAVKDGATIYIEAKMWPKTPTPIQKDVLKDLSLHGAPVYVFTYVPKINNYTIEEMYSNGITVPLTHEEFLANLELMQLQTEEEGGDY